MTRRKLVTVLATAIAVGAAILTVPTLAFADTNLALGKTVTVSSTDNTVNAANFAVDGNTSTRWSSAYSDPQ